MKVSLLVLLLGAASTTAYFTGRIYLLMAENTAQAVAAEQRQREFLTTPPGPAPLPEWKGERPW